MKTRPTFQQRAVQRRIEAKRVQRERNIFHVVQLIVIAVNLASVLYNVCRPPQQGTTVDLRPDTIVQDAPTPQPSNTLEANLLIA